MSCYEKLTGNSEAHSEAFATSEEVDADTAVEGKIIMATTDSANLKYLPKNINISTGESYRLVLRPKIVTYPMYEEDCWCLINVAMFAHHRRENGLLAMDSLQLQYVENDSKVACIKEKIDRNFCKISFDLASPEELISFDCE